MLPRPARPPRTRRKNVIFILLAGAPSHTDTFDLKMVTGVTPTSSRRTPSTACCFPPACCRSWRNALRRVRPRALHAVARAGAFARRRPGRRSAAIRRRRWATSRPISAAWWPSRRTSSASPQIFPAFLALNSRRRRRTRDICPRTTRPFKVHARRCRHRQHHQPRRADALQQALEADALAGRQSAHDSPDGRPMDDYNDFYIGREAADVQPGGQPGLRLHRRRQRCATAATRLPSAMPAWWPRRC